MQRSAALAAGRAGATNVHAAHSGHVLRPLRTSSGTAFSTLSVVPAVPPEAGVGTTLAPLDAGLATPPVTAFGSFLQGVSFPTFSGACAVPPAQIGAALEAEAGERPGAGAAAAGHERWDVVSSFSSTTTSALSLVDFKGAIEPIAPHSSFTYSLPTALYKGEK